MLVILSLNPSMNQSISNSNRMAFQKYFFASILYIEQGQEMPSSPAYHVFSVDVISLSVPNNFAV